MPPVYRHEVKTEVTVGKKVFNLNEQQTSLLKEMSLAGKSSIVWFDGFAISIPHISSIEIVQDRYIKEEWVHMPWMSEGVKEYVANDISKELWEKEQGNFLLEKLKKLENP